MREHLDNTRERGFRSEADSFVSSNSPDASFSPNVVPDVASTSFHNIKFAFTSLLGSTKSVMNTYTFLVEREAPSFLPYLTPSNVGMYNGKPMNISIDHQYALAPAMNGGKGAGEEIAKCTANVTLTETGAVIFSSHVSSPSMSEDYCEKLGAVLQGYGDFIHTIFVDFLVTEGGQVELRIMRHTGCRSVRGVS